MKIRTKAWILFLILGWMYPFFRIYYRIKNYTLTTVDYIENGLKIRERKSHKKEWKYKWNTILDRDTCKFCSEMDGKILTKKEMRKTKPPLHGLDENNQGCRCYLTLTK